MYILRCHAVYQVKLYVIYYVMCAIYANVMLIYICFVCYCLALASGSVDRMGAMMTLF